MQQSFWSTDNLIDYIVSILDLNVKLYTSLRSIINISIFEALHSVDKRDSCDESHVRLGGNNELKSGGKLTFYFIYIFILLTYFSFSTC